MEVALAQEKIWFDKYKYEEAEKVYFENISKLLTWDGYMNKKTESDNSETNIPPSLTPETQSDNMSTPSPDLTITITTEPRNEDKRFKVKNRNKSKKDVEKKVEKYIKHEPKVDGIAKLTTDNVAVEITNRLNSLETENSNLKKDVSDLSQLVRQLSDRLKVLESKSGSALATKPVAAPPKPAAKPQVEDDDDGVDLFGSDSEEEDEQAKKIKEQRLAEYAARKSKKPALIAKSNIILDVKPWDDETDMKKMEEEVRKITTDGLIWGASKLVPLAYGIHKLQISSVVEDDKVSVDWLQEQLEAIEDYVQSVDIAAFNKV